MATCYRHPDRETGLSCSECGRPICTDCVTFAPVGLRCPDHAASGGRPQGVQHTAQRVVRRTTRVGPTDAIVTKILVAANVIVYLITVAQPFILWIGVAISALVYRSIGAWQIMLINNRRLPEGFKVSRLNTWLLWITVVTGFGGVAYWMVTVLPKELCKNWKILC